MERLMMNDGGIQALVSSIGCCFDGSFFVSDECTDALQELITLLNEDDKTTCHIRCQMHLSHILPQKLVPLLISLDEEDDVEDRAKLYSLTIRLMTNLTQPTECLLPSYMCGQSTYKNLVTDMNKFLAAGRDAFLDGKVIAVLLRQMEQLLVEAEDREIHIDGCEILNNCLFLFRNLLFIHDLDCRTDDGPRPYVVLLGLLFQHGLTDVLMLVMKSSQREYWCIAAAQLVSLLYKDEVCTLNSSSCAHTVSHGMPVDHLTCPDSDTNLLIHCANHACGNSSSGYTELTKKRDSSPDNFQNHNSPCFDGESLSNSNRKSESHSHNSPRRPSPTSTPNGSSCGPPESASLQGEVAPESLKAGSAQSESHHGDWTPLAAPSRQGSTHTTSPVVSTIGNCSSRSSTSCDIQRKGVLKLENEISLRLTQLKIREQLSIFTKCFLEEGFVPLVTAMRSILLDSQQTRLPDLYFMWVVGYFLNWAVKLRVPFKSFKPCLSVDIVGFLVYVGVSSWEQYMLAMQDRKDPATDVRRNQMVVVALNKLFTAMDHLSEMEMDEDDAGHLRHLYTALVRMREVKNFFVLMLRHYNPSALSLDHLRDIIMTNHKFLLIAEKARTGDDNSPDFDMLQHIQSFSTSTIMGQYCRLLENFNKNTTEVNDCIFTMMYHVAGDVSRPEVLLQLPILKIFTEISETCVNLPRECNDVMNYVLQYFLNLASSDPYRCAEMLFGNMNGELMDMEVVDEGAEGGDQQGTNAREALNNWSDAEKDILFSLFSEESESPNLLSKIKEALLEDGFERTPNEIAVQLCMQNLWSQEQIEDLISPNKDKEDDPKNGADPSARRNSFMQIDMESNSGSIGSSSNSADGSGSGSTPERNSPEPLGVEHLVGRLILKGHEDVVRWLQTDLLEACYVKLGGRFLREGWVPEEPVILHFAIQNESIPLVPYTDTEEWAINSREFQQILKIMGFHMPQPGVLMWPRVPGAWTPMELVAKARMLGPVDMESQKFEEDDLQKHIELGEKNNVIMSEGSTHIMEGNTGKIHLPGMHMSDLWHVFVKQCTLYNMKQFDSQKMNMMSSQSNTGNY